MEEKFNRFFEVISEDQPSGDDLSFSAEFDRIQEARREDDPTMDYGEWQITLKQADWNEVISSCTQLLQTRSKDLRLAGWISELCSTYSSQCDRFTNLRLTSLKNAQH